MAFFKNLFKEVSSVLTERSDRALQISAVHALHLHLPLVASTQANFNLSPASKMS